jgi:hypothetical protein
MTEIVIEMSEEEFDAAYPLVPNHINPRAGWVVGADGRGCLFETYGDEFDYVRRFDRLRVWTLIDGDDGDLYVVSGLHCVNRVGYLLSRNRIPADVFVQVRIPMSADGGEG